MIRSKIAAGQNRDMSRPSRLTSGFVRNQDQQHEFQGGKKLNKSGRTDWETRRRAFYLLCGYHGLNESFRADAEVYVARASEAKLRMMVESHFKGRKPGRSGFDGTRAVKKTWVDDPFDPDYQIQVKKNIRHDYLEKLYSEELIGPAQKRAGDRVRELVETLGVGLGSVKAIDLERIRVDTSGPGADMRVTVINAADVLVKLSQFVDADKYALVVRICGFEEGLSKVAQAFEHDESQKVNGNCSARTRDHCGRLFRSGLTQAAIFFGYASKRETARYHASTRVWASDESSRGAGLST